MGEFYPDDLNQDRILSKDEVLQAAKKAFNGERSLTDDHLIENIGVNKACLMYSILEQLEAAVAEDPLLPPETKNATIEESKTERAFLQSKLQETSDQVLSEIHDAKETIRKGGAMFGQLLPYLELEHIDIPDLSDLCPNYVTVVSAEDAQSKNGIEL